MLGFLEGVLDLGGCFMGVPWSGAVVYRDRSSKGLLLP